MSCGRSAFVVADRGGVAFPDCEFKGLSAAGGSEVAKPERACLCPVSAAV